MIFVSFGNAPAEMTFTRLAEAADRLAELLNEEVLVQTGNTRYEFRHARTVGFLDHDQMLAAMRNASVIVLQGGWGTISEAIALGKRIVSVPRRMGQECNHPQEEVVRYLEKQGCLLGCYNTEELPALVEKARSCEFKPLRRGDSHEIINRFIKNSVS